MAHVGIVGAGTMGLAAAYHALKAGHTVEIFEADKVAGGMAAHFDFGGVSIERFYHFVCKSDQSTFDLMAELGIANAIKWRPTTMGYFINGHHFDWGDPLSLLRFPKLGLIDKLRYGAHMFLSTKRSDWHDLETISAKDWFISNSGQRVYDVLWRRLFELKFFEFADNVSAAWIWTRIKRIGTSRKSIFKEELGYIEGGSEALVGALVSAIEAQGGKIHLSSTVNEITSEDLCVTGIKVDGEFRAFDQVISTVPTPFVSRLVPGLPEESKARYDAIRNVGVVCLLLKLRKPVTGHFWLNINDPRIDIPGLVEFSNLRSFNDHMVYVPYYMPQSHPKFDREDAHFVREAMEYLSLLNPSITHADLIDCNVGRLKYAQPVCEAGFLAKIPPVMTPIAGLQIADTCYYYPEDRGISESVRYGKLIAAGVADPAVWQAEGR